MLPRELPEGCWLLFRAKGTDTKFNGNKYDSDSFYSVHIDGKGKTKESLLLKDCKSPEIISDSNGGFWLKTTMSSLGKPVFEHTLTHSSAYSKTAKPKFPKMVIYSSVLNNSLPFCMGKGTSLWYYGSTKINSTPLLTNHEF